MSRRDFYKRQTVLKDVGTDGQEKLGSTKVLIVGAGGLGHPVGVYAAAAGFGEISILDFDTIEESNLNRQVIFKASDVGRPKARVLKENLSEQNPYIDVFSIMEKLTPLNAEKIIGQFDLVFDCCDNFTTKFLIHDTCFFLEKKLIQASLYQYEGQIQVFDFSRDNEKGCLRCLWPIIPSKDCTGSCQEAGIIGAVAGSLGTIQAMEGIKSILNLGTQRNCQTTTVDLLNLETNKINWSHSKDCLLCSKEATIRSIESKHYENKEEVELIGLNHSDMIFIDIREKAELTKNDPVGLVHRPLSEFSLWKEEIDKNENYLFICSKGIRSLSLAKKLNQDNFKNCYSLFGGLDSL